MEKIKKINEIKQFLKSKGFTDKSIKTYASFIDKIIGILGEEFTQEDLEDYFTDLDLAPRTYNCYRTIANFYTKKYRGFKVDFTRAKVSKEIPLSITKEEINKILKSIPNFKHKLIIAIMYGSGLRVSEVVRIKKHHINIDKFSLFVEKGKGKKDRIVFVPKQLIRPLEIYIPALKTDYLFPTYRGHISERSVQELLKRIVKKCGFSKRITCHKLRHSFAINLLNKGVDIIRIKELLGHNSLKATEIYLKCITIDLKALAHL